jgi:hypothetical protein
MPTLLMVPKCPLHFQLVHSSFVGDVQVAGLLLRQVPAIECCKCKLALGWTRHYVRETTGVCIRLGLFVRESDPFAGVDRCAMDRLNIMRVSLWLLDMWQGDQ